jgi:hypothetical protein
MPEPEPEPEPKPELRRTDEAGSIPRQTMESLESNERTAVIDTAGPSHEPGGPG